jgi:hypothetical protein
MVASLPKWWLKLRGKGMGLGIGDYLSKITILYRVTNQTVCWQWKQQKPTCKVEGALNEL